MCSNVTGLYCSNPDCDFKAEKLENDRPRICPKCHKLGTLRFKMKAVKISDVPIPALKDRRRYQLIPAIEPNEDTLKIASGMD